MSKQAENYKDKGNAEFKKGNHEKAIEFYTYATEMDPNNPIFYTNRSFAYYKIGMAHKEKGNKEEFEKHINKSLRDALKAVTKGATWAKGHYRAAMAYVELGQFKEAVASIEQAANIDPKKFAREVDPIKKAMYKGMSQAAIDKEKGNEMFKSGKIDEAIKTYAAAISKCGPGEEILKADIHANRAACYRQLYLPEETIKDCTAALELVPDHVKALIRRAQAYESMEKYKKAYEDFNKAKTLSPGTDVAVKGVNRIRDAMKKLGMM